MSRLKAISTLLFNNRLEQYEKIIKLALENDYQVISFRDYARNDFDPSKKIFILRHDIDFESKATVRMFAIEKKYGVKASYYFRDCTADAILIKMIESYGSEASFHYETIADFVRARNIGTKEELLKTDFKNICLEILKKELERFRLLYNVPCETIASHGHVINKRFKLKNTLLTENEESYKFLNIKLETYNKRIYGENSCYISDANPLKINGGYYSISGTNPLQAIKNEIKLIKLLTHPHLWHFSSIQKIKIIRDCLI